jgi:hypothetical protein
MMICMSLKGALNLGLDSMKKMVKDCVIHCLHLIFILLLIEACHQALFLHLKVVHLPLGHVLLPLEALEATLTHGRFVAQVTCFAFFLQ